MTLMRSLILMTVLAAAAGAQQLSPPTSVRDTVVPLDRIVAVVGDQPITQYDLQERLLAVRQSPDFRAPENEAEFRELMETLVNQLVDEEILVQKARQVSIEVLDAQLTGQVDRQLRDVRARFGSEAELRAELTRAGLGSPEEYRRFLMDNMRRGELQRRVIEKMRSEGRIPPVNVRESEVEEAFNRARGSLPRRPASVTFRQIVVAPRPTEAARNAARVRAESLLAEIRSGAEFERVARRESADSATREQGGDLGWNRRGVMVQEFEQWMFGLRPGNMSPVFETVHGFHILRVDRVQPGEVKSRHILVRPVIDSADVARARVEADSVARLWAGGVPFDTLAKRHHDFASGEETSILTPVPVDSGLPDSYRQGFAGKGPGDFAVFPIATAAGFPKFVVAQIITRDQGGEYTLKDLRERVRAQLVEEGSYRRYLDSLRKEIYVSIRLDPPPGSPGPGR
jgi:peptidyl-prolyl cis-trans isomerase SurA